MKNKQGITIASLIVAIIGLSVGFAAFSNTLTISSSASVNPDDSTLNVVWSSSSSSAATDSISPTKDPNNITNFTATNGSITGNDSRTLNNLSASFTAPGQSVEYSLYVYNAGQLQAQLTGITFNNATNATAGETYKHCYAKTDNVPSAQQATDSLVTSACEGISISVSIGTATGVTPQTTGDKAALNYQLINKNSALEATVTITYASGSAYVDGPMEVEFGNIDINATSAVDETRVVTSSQISQPSESCVITNEKSFNTCTLETDSGTQGLSMGDKVTCGTESFYIIENPSNNVVKMLSEWNLNVSEEGEMISGVDYSYEYCRSTTGYQDSHVRANVDTENNPLLIENTILLTIPNVFTDYPWGYGIVKFDRVTTGDYGYWTTGENHTLNTSVYTQNNNGSYPAYVYDSNATLKTFIDTYVGYLNSTLSTNATGRLITYEELEALGCSASNNTCVSTPAPAWVYQTSYWSGSAQNHDNLWYIDSNGGMLGHSFRYRQLGVRPVIEISSSAIQTS